MSADKGLEVFVVDDEDAPLVEPSLLVPGRVGYGDAWRDLAALLLDAEMRKLARGRSLVDLRLCQLLARLGQGGAQRLGFVKLTDYGREQLGLSDRYVREMARVGRALAGLPLVCEAMERGDVGLTKVRQLVRVLGEGTDADEQKAWIERARGWTTRRLEQEVRAHLKQARESSADEQAGEVSAVEPTPEEYFDVSFKAPASLQGKWHWVLELVRRVNGSNLSDGAALEAVLMEFLSGMLEQLGEQELPDVDEVGEVEQELERRRVIRDLAASWPAIAEQVTRDWEFLEHTTPKVLLPEWAGDTPAGAFEIDELLRRLMKLRQRVEWHLSQLALSFSRSGLWREMQFASIEHYARERLDISGRAFRKRVSLARKCAELPRLGEAVRTGELGVTKAEWVARVAMDRTEAEWVERARSTTLRALEAEARPVAEDPWDRYGELPPTKSYRPGAALEKQPRRVTPWADDCASDDPEWQMRAAKAAEVEDVTSDSAMPTAEPVASIRCRVTAEGRRLWMIALELCRMVAGEEVPEWKCVEKMLDHFVGVWGQGSGEAPEFGEVLERDGYQCAVPGCRNRRNLGVHHIRFRSHGGGDQAWNLVTMCFGHHIEGIHEGKLRVRGRAPDELIWELGLRQGEAVARYVGDRLLRPRKGKTREAA